MRQKRARMRYRSPLVFPSLMPRGRPRSALHKCQPARASPPQAPAMGRAACRGDASSPTNISRLISSPTRKKKTAIKPSLIQWCRLRVSPYPGNPMVSGTSHRYDGSSPPMASSPSRARERYTPTVQFHPRIPFGRTAGTDRSTRSMSRVEALGVSATGLLVMK